MTCGERERKREREKDREKDVLNLKDIFWSLIAKRESQLFFLHYSLRREGVKVRLHYRDNCPAGPKG
jgi:hypothetical protein